DLPEARHRLALEGLKDDDAFVRRAAAEALGRHPSPPDIRPLLDLRQKVDAADTHLLHAVRMALRDQLRPASTWGRLPSPLSERDARDLADVAPGVPSVEAARLLMSHIKTYREEGDDLLRYVHHVARYGDNATRDALLAFARVDRAGDLGHQAA